MSIVNIETLEQFFEVVKGEKVVIDFHGVTWCNPCKVLAGNLDKVVAKNPDVTIGKVDVNVFDGLANEFKVEKVPRLVFFKKGQLQEESLQSSDYKHLNKAIKKILD